jgi:deazaflavin-dependent oxidoreductase (nitroreductase family)
VAHPAAVAPTGRVGPACDDADVGIPRVVYRAIWALDRLLDRLSGGRFDEIRRGPRTLRLTTTGRKSGEPRENALYYLETDGAYAVVASNAGGDSDPGWWLNLQARPDASIRLGRRRLPVRARKATPDEETALWPALDRMFPAYRSYRTMTTRPISIVLLEPTLKAASQA